MVNNLDDKQNNPLVSFVVNCYNGERYLNKCISSIFDQTYTNWELIFWDNASIDSSAEIFKSYNDVRFKYFKSNINVTLGQARAWAVDECKGDYIAFLDVDDEWIPNKTSIQVSRMIEEKSVLSYGGIIECYETTPKTKRILAKHLKGDIFVQNLWQFEINMPTIMIRRSSLLEKKLNFDPKIYASEEYCLSMQLIINENVSVIEKPLAVYLVRGESLTNKHIDKWAIERRYTLDKILQSNPLINEKLKKPFQEAIFRANYYEARYLKSIGKDEEAIEIIKPSIYFSIKYFIVYILLISPNAIWELFQREKYNRN